MRCPYCKETIDDDSLYCDLCGHELSFCPDCRAPKRGTECPLCGATLISGKDFFKASTVGAASGSADSLPRYLVGEGMRLELKEGVFGRRGGIYPELASCIFVSGRHGAFSRTPDGWTVTDLGSTNGTYLNSGRLRSGESHPIRKGDVLKISRLSFNIE